MDVVQLRLYSGSLSRGHLLHLAAVSLDYLLLGLRGERGWWFALAFSGGLHVLSREALEFLLEQVPQEGLLPVEVVKQLVHLFHTIERERVEISGRPAGVVNLPNCFRISRSVIASIYHF